MKWCMAVVLSVIAGYAGAATEIYLIHLTWAIPTKRVDGTPLPLTQLRNYTLLYSCDTGRSGTRVVAPPSLSAIDLLGDWLGNCTFAMTATDTAGITGPQSEPVTLLIKLNAPSSGGMQ